MTATRRPLIVSSAALVAIAAVVLPAGTGMAAERAPMLSYDFTGLVPSALMASHDEPAPAPTEVAEAQPALDKASVTCMAKVIHHEARYQPRSGQIAVAQTLINRVKAGGRFGNTICAVAKQPGQYFNLAAYHPQQDETWDAAVDIARDTLSGDEDQVVPGAIFFRAAYTSPTSFFRTRQRIASIGDHVFYR